MKFIIKNLLRKNNEVVATNDLETLKSAARTKHMHLFPTKLPISNKIPIEFIRQEPWEIEYLYLLAKRSKLGILETGRFNGGSVMIFAYANKNVPIYSIDIAPQNDEHLQNILSQNNIGENVNLIIGDSQKTKYDIIKAYDLLFIDGDHSYQGCLNDLNNWWDGLAIGGHVVLHDCYYGCEVQDAVLDFVKDKNIRFFQSPYIGSYNAHKRFAAGSLCHFQKI